jgi:hypothetical protein
VVPALAFFKDLLSQRPLLPESIADFVVNELKKIVRFIGSPSGNFH